MTCRDALCPQQINIEAGTPGTAPMETSMETSHKTLEG